MRQYIGSAVLCALALVFFHAGCDDSKKTTETENERENTGYYVSFRAGDNDIVDTDGLGATVDSGKIRVTGSLPSSSGEDYNYITIDFSGTSAGEYTVSGTGSTFDFEYWTGYNEGCFPYSGTATLTKVGEIGDTVEGTFEANMNCYYDVTMPDYSYTMNMTNGHIRVVRLEP